MAPSQQEADPEMLGHRAYDTQYERFDATSETETLTPRTPGQAERSLGPLDPHALGYLICALVLLEGIALMADICNVSFHVDLSLGPGYRSAPEFRRQGPFEASPVSREVRPSQTLQIVISTIAFGDIFASVLGFVGIALTRWRLIGPLCWWRFVVAILGAPAVGILVAESQPAGTYHIAAWASTLLYIAAGLVIAHFTYQVMCAFTAIKVDREMRVVVGGAIGTTGTGAPLAFGCLPLEETVVGYALALLGFSAWAMVFLITQNHGSNGWAFFTSLPRGTASFWLEAVVLVAAICFSLVATSGVTAFGEAAMDEERLRAANVGGGSLGETYREEMLGIQQVRKRAQQWILTFLVFNAVRLSFFVPITGMAFVRADICGLYVRGLSSVSAYEFWPAGAAPVRCSWMDLLSLLSTLAFAALDTYLAFGAFRLWHYYRGDRQATGALWNKAAGSYGALTSDPPSGNVVL